jgi:hypothetical protein
MKMKVSSSGIDSSEAISREVRRHKETEEIKGIHTSPGQCPERVESGD